MSTTRLISLFGLALSVAAAGGRLCAQDEAPTPQRGNALELRDAEPPHPTATYAVQAVDGEKAAPPEAIEPQREAASNGTQTSGAQQDDQNNCQKVGQGHRWQNVTKPRLQYHYWGYAPFFHEPDLGANVYPLLNAQIGSALAEQLVLYNYDFVDNGTGSTLNYHGMRQLCRMAGVLAHCDYSLMIERTDGNPTLDEARRRAVLQAAASLAVSVPEDRVVVACPIARGLRGTEAEIIDANQLRQTLNGMQPRSYTSAAAFSAVSGTGTGSGTSPSP